MDRYHQTATLRRFASAIPTNFSKQSAAKITVGMSTSPIFLLAKLAIDSWWSTSNSARTYLKSLNQKMDED